MSVNFHLRSMSRIVVAFDSFKGSLSAVEANEAFAAGFRSLCPNADIAMVPISDGGEGLSECVGGDSVEALIADPLGRRIAARYTIKDDTAVIALASASGLTILDASERNPLITSTFGTGEMVVDALHHGCRRIVLGLGGSATNDCATGMLRALGFRFVDAQGRELTRSIDILEHTATILRGDTVPKDVELAVAVDVHNPLYGADGAAEVYARQKGASEEDVVRLDSAMRHFAATVARHVGADYSHDAGMGAAGGAAFGLRALLGATPTSGIELMLRLVNFDTLLRDAHLVVTGEGHIDRQTLMGKAPLGVLRRAQRAGVRCVAVGGGVAWEEVHDDCGFAAVYAATPHDMPLSSAMQRDTACANLYAVGRLVAKEYGD